jgi:hypothetical protein
MANESQQLSDILNKGAQPEQGKGIQAALPGLSLDKILGDIGKELQTQAAHGAHELAAALFNGSAFVMYPRNSGQRDDAQQGQPAIEPVQQPEMQQEHSRGGMGR